MITAQYHTKMELVDSIGSAGDDSDGPQDIHGKVIAEPKLRELSKIFATLIPLDTSLFTDAELS